MIIRKAKAEDADQIANVHVETWRAAYQGILPDDTLSTLSLKKQADLWKTSLSDPNDQEVVFVAEETGGSIAGFASGGPSRLQHSAYQGEVSAIYLLPRYHKQGIGRRMMQTVARELKKQNMNSLMVWVLADNPSAAFYERLGGRTFASQKIRYGNMHVKAIAIGWADIKDVLQ
ncbi:GNAT family N-acetyltransferase [Bacillus sp. z60-18]|uniref:GNAT family N-acetyltransferase n=1 Tax=Bacillus TaxID=1386 RepID=UPI00098A26DE|nr:GNAT family N-acetyltransferase [Bacillus sonorensis]